MRARQCTNKRILSDEPCSKKLAVFSTKNNATTKENIANVYGAKTIPALIPLKLELELQPTAPSQALADLHNDDSTRSRQVTIVGHISRPVHGDGRQTPDRQMFFVNSRPCGLPQIAKAFNEVYKSYNLNQSPFVFADFKMDTNAYDVNVSPDKRTIMLHDQGRLIESLKERLIVLFEAQDQTVPLSQLPGQKLQAFRPLTVNRGPSSPLDQRSSEVAGPKSPLGTLSSKPSASMASSTIGTSSLDSETSARPNLVSKFATRNIESGPEPRVSTGLIYCDPTGPSKDKQNLIRKLQRQAAGGNDGSESPNPKKDSSSSLSDRQCEANEKDDEGLQATRDMQGTVGMDSNNHEIRKTSSSLTDNVHGLQREIPVTPNQRSIAYDGCTRANSIVPKTAALVDGNVVSQQSLKMTVDPPKSISKQVDGDSQSAGLHRPTNSPFVAARSLSKPQSSAFAGSLSAFAAPGTQVDLGRLATDDISLAQTEELVDEADQAFAGTAVDSEGEVNRQEESGADLVLLNEDEDNEGSHQDNSDDEYLDEEARKLQEEARVQEMLRLAEESAAQSTQEQRNRNANLLKQSSDKDSTVNLIRFLNTSMTAIESKARRLHQEMQEFAQRRAEAPYSDEAQPPSPKASAEDRLSLTISKSDFADMRVVGQFNLGFILAVRPALHTPESSTLESRPRKMAQNSYELFIIDQHASDEIYNFSRLSLTTTLTPQPLVRPHVLHLTAIEEETVLAHKDHSLAKNGFTISVDQSGESPVGQRCSLLTLPTSRETIFNTRDLEELLALLADVPAPPPTQNPTDSVDEKADEALSLLNVKDATTRPTKVRRMLAMRACRSSIMIGKSLSTKGMQGVVKRMGEIERPWNCPHGRPTMRHLTSLGDLGGWSEEDAQAVSFDGDEQSEDVDMDEDDVWVSSSGRVDWGKYIAGHKNYDEGDGGGGYGPDAEEDEEEVYNEYDAEAAGDRLETAGDEDEGVSVAHSHPNSRGEAIDIDV